MKLEHSDHWILRKRDREDIEDYLIEYAIINSRQIRDKKDRETINAVCHIPNIGKTIKVVYKIRKERLLIITAFWI